GMGVQHGFLGGTRMFTLLEPIIEDGNWTLSCDLPGEAAARLVASRNPRQDEANARAVLLVHRWLHRYAYWLECPDKVSAGQCPEQPDTVRSRILRDRQCPEIPANIGRTPDRQPDTGQTGTDNRT